MINKNFCLIFSICLVGIYNHLSAQTPPDYLDDSKPIEQRVEHALSLMTLKEKVDLCHAQSKFSSKGVARLGIPEVWMADGPHGVREEILWDNWGAANWTNDSSTAFPALTCLAATFNPEMSAAYGKAVGEEARYRNKSILLGPGVNIYRTPLNGRNFEYLGEDPFLASTMVVPYIKGVQSNGVAACVKHFALNNQEKWRSEVDVQVSDRALREIYLPAFYAAVTEGKVWSVMGAYNKFRGQHCCHNDLLLNQILKKEWRFDGVVVSDWGGTHNLMEAARNGLDIEMGTNTNGMTSNIANFYENYFLASPFLTALQEKKVDEEVVNDKARRILRLIFRTAMNRNRPFGSFQTPEHAAVGRAVLQEGIVLLKNEQNVLPITNAIKTIAVIGENATRRMTEGGGSSGLKVKYEVSPLGGIKSRFGKSTRIEYAMGYGSGKSLYDQVAPSPYNAKKLRDEAVTLAGNSDMVVFVGGLNKSSNQDCEGRDRETYSLPFEQNELIKAITQVNKKVIIVLVSGNAVEMPWVADVQAIVQAWYGGTEAGNAIADILSGDFNPSGKLPFSFPVKLDDNGAMFYGSASYPGDTISKDNYKQTYMEDILVGYRWHDTKGIKPLFAFGHGLSYTSFEIGKLGTDKTVYTKNEKVRISFTLTNTGKKDGAEVVQVYITETNAPVLRPAKELKGFKKVFLKPGESKQVTIELPAQAWSYFNEKTQSFTLNSGQYEIHVGNASNNIKAKAVVKIR